MNAVITNQHHFCGKMKIEITNGKVSKFISKSGMDLTTPRDMGEFITKVYETFCMTGVDTADYDSSEYAPQMKLDDVLLEQRERADEVKAIIRAQLLEFNVVLIEEGICFCNMGHCGATTSFQLISREPKTYGELMDEFGSHYPDSVLLCIEQVVELPETFTPCGASTAQKTAIQLDPEKKYLKFYYYR